MTGVRFYLPEAMRIAGIFDENGIVYIISSKPYYKKYYTCKARIEINRL